MYSAVVSTHKMQVSLLEPETTEKFYIPNPADYTEAINTLLMNVKQS